MQASRSTHYCVRSLTVLILQKETSNSFLTASKCPATKLLVFWFAYTMAILQRTTNVASLTLLPPEDALSDPEVRGEWESFSRVGNPLTRVFRSPSLYEHQTRLTPLPENRVAVLRDGNGTIVGVCPIVLWKVALSFAIRKRVLATKVVKAATILGGEPLLAADPALFRFLINRLFAGLPWCDCVYMNSIPVESFACKMIYSNDYKRGGYFIHPRRLQAREWIYLEPGASLESFLEGKQKRTRNTLKRRVKKLREHGAGCLECIRVETEDQVDTFYESAFTVAEKSWQHANLGQCLEETSLYRKNLQSLARLGVLRAYLLKCGGIPCAFVIGYQCEDTLQFEQTAFSSDFARLSPGTVLYYMMLEDLYRYRPPRLVNHGVGVTPHKRLFSNRESVDTSVHLFRPTIRNRLLCTAHALFNSALGVGRRFLAKRPSPPRESEENE
jgi:Acetyltransferase (GNAT) domain